MIVFVPDATRILDVIESPAADGTVASVPVGASPALIAATLRRTHAVCCLVALALAGDTDAALAAGVGLYFCRVLWQPLRDFRGAA